MIVSAWIALTLASGAPSVEPGHAANPVYVGLLRGELVLEGVAVPIPPPAFRDGGTAKEQRDALNRAAGSTARARDLLKDSVTAPFVLKPPPAREPRNRAGDVVRSLDLGFVVHSDLDTIDASRLVRMAGPVEAGNVRFEWRFLEVGDLKGREIDPAPKDEWYSHLSGRLLDRILFETTARVVASRSPGSLVVAWRTSDAFDRDPSYPNLWRKLFRNAEGRPTAPGPANPYPGGGGYLKVSRLDAEPGALFVECHAALLEPRAWFEGAPLLRPKIGPAAESWIRALRRDLARAKEPAPGGQ